MITRKRVNIILDEMTMSRAFVVIDNNAFQCIEHNGSRYYSEQDFYENTLYQTLVVSDRHVLSCLKYAGFEVRGMVQKRQSLHVSIPLELLEQIKEDAAIQRKNVSILVEEILTEFYKYKN